MSTAEEFLQLFSGNPAAHYTFDTLTKAYDAVESGITLADVERHLRGEQPGLLSIPVFRHDVYGRDKETPETFFLCNFAAADCDRHKEEDEAIKYEEVAKKIDELHLPLIIARSKSPKSAHIYLFFVDRDGFDAATARRLIIRYTTILDIRGEIEIFPKQTELKFDEEGKMAIGSGINLPYFGQSRTAYGFFGEPIDLTEFLRLAHERQSLGRALALRDLGDGPSYPGAAEADETDHPMYAATAKKIHTDNLEALKKSNAAGHWNDTINKTAFFAGRVFAAKVFDITEVKLKDQIREAAAPRSGSDERQMESTLESGWSKGILQPLKIIEDLYPEATACLKDFNERFYVVEDFGNRVRVCWEAIDPITKTLNVGNQSPEDFTKRYRHQRIVVGEEETTSGKGNDKKTTKKPVIKTKGEFWLDHKDRRQYDQVLYAPGEDLGPTIRNLWRGFAVEAKKGKGDGIGAGCHLYLTHLLENICKNDQAKFQHLTRWLAWKFRHPGEKSYTALAFRGAEGTGKGMLTDPLIHLFGAHGFAVTRKEHLSGKFNNHLRACSLVIANEAFHAGDKQHEASLKGLITDDFYMIEAKGIDAVPCRNRMSIIITSNEQWAVPAGAEARRYTVYDVGDAHREDTGYFGALQIQLSGGRSGSMAGYKALLFHLLNEVQMGDFDPRKALKTAALSDQKSQSLHGVESVWYEILYRGELPGATSTGSLGNSYLATERLLTWARLQHNRKWQDISAEQVGLFLGMNPRGVFKGLQFEKDRTTQGRMWVINPLKMCRNKWDAARFKVDWPEIDVEQGGLADECVGWDYVKVGDEPPPKSY